MRQILVTAAKDGADYYVLDFALRRVMSAERLAEELRERHQVAEGDEVHFYSGFRDWFECSPETYAQVVSRLVTAIRLLRATPILVGCACFREQKEELAHLLRIEFRHNGLR